MTRKAWSIWRYPLFFVARTTRESLINSESFRCEVKIRQIKAPIAAKTQSNRFAHGADPSQSIGKIGNDELVRSDVSGFNEQMLIHELIIDSLCRPSC
jgi:hypothetical protein